MDLTVIGVGSRLRGDDAIGPLVIDALEAQDHQGMELIDAGSDALGILEYLQGREHVIIIDACQMGQTPGRVKLIDPVQVDMVLKEDPVSLHGLGLAEAIRMGAALNMLPDHLKIIGIEPESIQFSGTISASLQKALKRVTKIVHDELGRLQQVLEA